MQTVDGAQVSARGDSYREYREYREYRVAGMDDRGLNPLGREIGGSGAADGAAAAAA